jgi:hypothetical protein
MKVNISGKGVIPGLNTLAPVYNVDLDKQQILRLLNFRNFRVYGVGTGLLTPTNVDAAFDASVENIKKNAEMKNSSIESSVKHPTPNNSSKQVVSAIHADYSSILEAKAKEAAVTEETSTVDTEEPVEIITDNEAEDVETSEEDATSVVEEKKTDFKYNGKKNKKKNRN